MTCKRRQYRIIKANTDDENHSYNRYLAVASRALRRSLKEDKRIIAERRGEAAEVKFAKWSVSNILLSLGYRETFSEAEKKEKVGDVTSEETWEQNYEDGWTPALDKNTKQKLITPRPFFSKLQNGKPGETVNLSSANAAAAAENATSVPSS